MNRTEAVQLARLVKALCPAQALDQYTPDAWALVLGAVEYEDAKAAVIYLGAIELEPGKARYIEPGHIIAEVRRIRRKRIDDHGPLDPPLDLDPAQYLAWLRGVTREVGSGRVAAQPAIADSPAGQQRFAALTDGIGGDEDS